MAIICLGTYTTGSRSRLSVRDEPDCCALPTADSRQQSNFSILHTPTNFKNIWYLHNTSSFGFFSFHLILDGNSLLSSSSVDNLH